MLSHFSDYRETILTACVLFPFIAGIFTLPFMVRQYRKFGGIAFMRVIVVYSFILYMLCAFLLTVLPLPSIEAVRSAPDRPIQWIPFFDLVQAMGKAGFSFDTPQTFVTGSVWKSFLTSSGLFQILANILMQIPLGFYLRYYFKRTLKQTLLIGLCVSLFYELTQLSGLFFIYPKPYRFTEMDDLINNTLGAVIGYWIAPLLMKLLPSRDAIDQISYDKGHRITVIRRVLAAGIDWMIFFVLVTLVNLYPPISGIESSMLFIGSNFFGYILWVLLYFCLAQYLMKGRTLGKMLLKIRVVNTDLGMEHRDRPSFRQLFARYGMIYFLTLPLAMAELMMVMMLALFVTADGNPSDGVLTVLIVVSAVLLCGLLFIFLRSYVKWGALPHVHVSRTNIVSDKSQNHGKTPESPDIPQKATGG